MAKMSRDWPTRPAWAYSSGKMQLYCECGVFAEVMINPDYNNLRDMLWYSHAPPGWLMRLKKDQTFEVWCPDCAPYLVAKGKK